MSCVYALDLGEPFLRGRPCMGNKIACAHPENALPVVAAKTCCPTGCRWHVLK